MSIFLVILILLSTLFTACGITLFQKATEVQRKGLPDEWLFVISSLANIAIIISLVVCTFIIKGQRQEIKYLNQKIEQVKK